MCTFGHYRVYRVKRFYNYAHVSLQECNMSPHKRGRGGGGGGGEHLTTVLHLWCGVLIAWLSIWDLEGPYKEGIRLPTRLYMYRYLYSSPCPLGIDKTNVSSYLGRLQKLLRLLLCTLLKMGSYSSTKMCQYWDNRLIYWAVYWLFYWHVPIVTHCCATVTNHV